MSPHFKNKPVLPQ